MKTFLRVCAIFALVVPLTVLAATNKKATPKEHKARPFVKINSVNTTANTITITDTDESNKTYSVDSFTTITVNGQPGKLADVHKGMKVDLTTSGTKASRIEASDPPEEKTEKKKKK